MYVLHCQWGIDISSGNDLAGSRVWAEGPPSPIVTSSPSVTGQLDESAHCFPGVFTASDQDGAESGGFPVVIPDSLLSVSCSDLVAEQRADPSGGGAES